MIYHRAQRLDILIHVVVLVEGRDIKFCAFVLFVLYLFLVGELSNFARQNCVDLFFIVCDLSMKIIRLIFAVVQSLFEIQLMGLSRCFLKGGVCVDIEQLTWCKVL